jgi:hypothetical protein
MSRYHRILFVLPVIGCIFLAASFPVRFLHRSAGFNSSTAATRIILGDKLVVGLLSEPLESSRLSGRAFLRRQHSINDCF